MHDSLAMAERVATIAHRGQVDKLGVAYVAHPRAVAQRLAARGASVPVQVIGWLHDVVEDTGVGLGFIEQVFGVRVRDGVEAMTHRRGEPNVDYWARVRRNPDARQCKLADLDDNTDAERWAALEQVAAPEVLDRLARKYARAREALA